MLLAAAVVFTIPFLWFVAARQHSIAHTGQERPGP
jgi:hypothetical protein